MLTTQRNQQHQIKAWYFKPILPTPNTDEELTWNNNPISFWAKDISKTRTGFNILQSYNVEANGRVLETESNIDFHDQGKIGFGRVAPLIDDASKITPEGITTAPTQQSNTVGTRFKTVYEKKRIVIG